MRVRMYGAKETPNHFVKKVSQKRPQGTDYSFQFHLFGFPTEVSPELQFRHSMYTHASPCVPDEDPSGVPWISTGTSLDQPTNPSPTQEPGKQTSGCTLQPWPQLKRFGRLCIFNRERDVFKRAFFSASVRFFPSFEAKSRASKRRN